jgi:mannose-6-phosphate isomerase-like protein (cupin superfamily)
VAAVDAPVLLGPGEGETIRPGFEIKIGRPELVMTEFRYAPGEHGPPPHIHRHHADAFYVLDGRLEYLVDDTRRILEPGAFVLVPPLLIHTFRNPGPGPAHALNIHAPGLGFDEYLRGRKPDFDQHENPGEGDWLPASAAHVLAPGEGRRLRFGDSTATVKAGSDDALGSFALIELELAPGFAGPLLHEHERMTDCFFVIEGELPLSLGERRTAAASGACAFVPPGTAHTFGGPADAPARVLNLQAPAGLERYLVEVGELGRAPTPREMAEFASRYDFRLV